MCISPDSLRSAAIASLDGREAVAVALALGEQEQRRVGRQDQRVEQHQGGDPLAVLRGVLDGHSSAEPVADDRHLVDPARVEHVVEIGDVLGRRLWPRPRRAAVPAQVVGDHPAVLLEHPGEPLEPPRVAAGGVNAHHRR